VEPTDVILFEGILALYDSKVRDSFSMKLFVDEDSDVRLSRRLVRDVLELGRGFDVTAQHYLKFVKPSFDDYILPVSTASVESQFHPPSSLIFFLFARLIV
jgi:uridine kinase